MVEIKDIAMLAALLKLYIADLVKHAYDNMECGADVDYKEIEMHVDALNDALEVVKEDLDFRLNN